MSKHCLLKVLGLGPKLKVQLFLENLATDYVPAGLAVSILYDHKTYTVHRPYIPVSFSRKLLNTILTVKSYKNKQLLLKNKYNFILTKFKNNLLQFKKYKEEEIQGKLLFFTIIFKFTYCFLKHSCYKGILSWQRGRRPPC